MRLLKLLAVFLIFPSCAAAGAGKKDALSAVTLLPSFQIPYDRPALDLLTAELRGKLKTLGLNNMEGLKGERLSRALLLLPADRSNAGVLSFELEGGSRPGVYQCEALGRGATYARQLPGTLKGVIGGTTIYYAPADVMNGITVPGVYDLRNITPDRYQITLLGKPEDLKGEEAVLAATANPDGKPKPFFSSVWKHWYPADVRVVPVDMTWAEEYQAGTQGEGRPFLELRPKVLKPEERARLEAQLAHNPRYYYGPYGRSGWAVHTDRWEDAGKRADPAFAGRAELEDFRFRDTSGCVKLRPGCLAVFNEFVAGQAALGRRVQLEVRELPDLSAGPAGPPPAKF